MNIEFIKNVVSIASSLTMMLCFTVMAVLEWANRRRLILIVKERDKNGFLTVMTIRNPSRYDLVVSECFVYIPSLDQWRVWDDCECVNVPSNSSFDIKFKDPGGFPVTWIVFTLAGTGRKYELRT